MERHRWSKKGTLENADGVIPAVAGQEFTSVLNSDNSLPKYLEQLYSLENCESRGKKKNPGETMLHVFLLCVVT